MKHFISALRERTRTLWHKLFDGKSKLNIAIDIATLLFFTLSVLSIPLCSFKAGLNKVTWVFTIAFLGLMILGVLLYYSIRVDAVTVSLIVFAIWIFISTLLNGFKGFTITPIALSIATLIIYLYLVNNKKVIPVMLRLVYFAIVLFALVYVAKYFRELISLDFKRLGAIFGDINDIAIILGIGFSMSFSLMLMSKFNVVKFIFELLAAALFAICGLSTGSKIFVLIVGVVSIVLLVFFLRKLKAKWYIYIVSFGGLIGLGLIILNLPAFSMIKQRLLEFGTDDSTKTRLSMFVDGFYMFLRKPLFGYGIHGYYISSSFGLSWSHNNFSELLSCYGLIGFLLFYIPYIILFKNVKKTDANLTKHLIMALVVLFICCMFTVALESQKVFAYLIPIAYAYFSGEKYLNFRLIAKKVDS